jgi:hypothetical protein
VDSRASASRLYRKIRMLDRLPLFSYSRPYTYVNCRFQTTSERQCQLSRLPH